MSVAAQIVATVAQQFGISETLLMGKSRQRIPCAARSQVYRTLYEDHGMSFAEIGRVMGRDCSTIVYSAHADGWHPSAGGGR